MVKCDFLNSRERLVYCMSPYFCFLSFLLHFRYFKIPSLINSTPPQPPVPTFFFLEELLAANHWGQLAGNKSFFSSFIWEHFYFSFIPEGWFHYIKKSISFSFSTWKIIVPVTSGSMVFVEKSAFSRVGVPLSVPFLSDGFQNICPIILTSDSSHLINRLCFIQVVIFLVLGIRVILFFSYILKTLLILLVDSGCCLFFFLELYVTKIIYMYNF